MSFSPKTRAQGLLEWFAANRRELPWRCEPRLAWPTLISELMLQQTQVDRVAPRFEGFIERFASPQAMVEAGEEAVLEAWSGLGYYSRARRLYRLAEQLVREQRPLPEHFCELLELPGIGSYTAAAVASLVSDEAQPVLDGNVLRVAARVLEIEEPPSRAEPRRRAAAWVCALYPGRSPGAVNEALMELGALVCRPKAPRCEACPLAADCRALAAGRQSELPRRIPRRKREAQRWAAALVVDTEGRWLLRPIAGLGVLEGLWLPPLLVLDEDQSAQSELLASFGSTAIGGRSLPSVRHAITFRDIEVMPVVLAASLELRGGRFCDPETPGLPTSSLLGKLVEVWRQSKGAESP